MFRQALEGVLGLRLAGGELVPPADLAPAGDLGLTRIVQGRDPQPLARPRRAASAAAQSDRGTKRTDLIAT